MSVEELDRTANLLGAVGIALHDELVRVMADASALSIADAAALNVVGHEPGCSIRHVSEVLSVTHGGAVRMIDRLERDRLVRRGPGFDGRTVAVRLTPAGRTRWRRQLDARTRRLRDIVTAAGSEAEAGLELTRVAEQILRVLTPDEQSAERSCRLCDIELCPQDRCPVDCTAKRFR